MSDTRERDLTSEEVRVLIEQLKRSCPRILLDRELRHQPWWLRTIDALMDIVLQVHPILVLVGIYTIGYICGYGHGKAS